MLPYILVFGYGNLIKNDLVPLKKFTFILGVIILFFILKEKNINIGDYKYPPRLIYIWYGIFCSNIFFLLKDKLEKLLEKSNSLKKIVQYIGKSTMWFYLIHIGVYYIIFFIKKKINLDWKIEYLILVLLSLGILFVKDMILNKIEKSFKKKSKILNILKG